MKDVKAFVDTLAAATAAAAHAKMMRDPWRKLYLYCCCGGATALYKDETRPMGYSMATEKALPRNMTRDGLQYWIAERLWKAPCMPREDGE